MRNLLEEQVTSAGIQEQRMNVFPVAVRASWLSAPGRELPASGAAPRGYQPLIPASGGSLPTGPRGRQRDAHTRLEIYQSSRETAAIEMGKFRKQKKTETEMLGRLRLRLGRRHSVWSSLVTLFLLPRRCPLRRRLRLLPCQSESPVPYFLFLFLHGVSLLAVPIAGAPRAN